MILHAGVVQMGSTVVAIPGAAESGKSTLTAGLVRSGWSYLSDELALIDPSTLLLDPYQRRISIDVGAYPLFPELVAQGYGLNDEQWHVEAADLCPNPNGSGGCPISHLVFNRYEAGASLAFEPLSRAQALHRLVENSVRLDRHGADGFEVLSDVASSAQSYELVAGSLDDQIGAINSLRA